MKYLFALILLIASCGGSGGEPLKEIDVTFVYAYDDKSNFELAKRSFFEAVKFYEDRLDIVINTEVVNIGTITQPKDHTLSNDPQYKKRSALTFAYVRKLNLKGIKVIVEPPYASLDSTGTAGHICSNFNVSYSGLSSFRSVWTLLAHELGHSLCMVHTDCPTCIMNTRSSEDRDFITDENIERFKQQKRINKEIACRL